jgi:hypothetical protein
MLTTRSSPGAYTMVIAGIKAISVLEAEFFEARLMKNGKVDQR